MREENALAHGTRGMRHSMRMAAGGPVKNYWLLVEEVMLEPAW
jgi:hypothetical protein